MATDQDRMTALDEIDRLLGKLVDLGDTDEAWKIRQVIDRVYPPAPEHRDTHTYAD